jgi:GTP cyclohydrolase I
MNGWKEVKLKAHSGDQKEEAMPADDDRDFIESMDLRRRRVSEAQMEKFAGYVAEIFTAFGMDLNTPATEDTPQRFMRALFDSTDGYDGDPKLLKVFDTECRGGPDCRLSQVIEGPIHFFALCEHHALPFYGHAYVGYIAHEQIIGISKLTRLVRLFAKRFTVQERIGQQVADALEAMLHPHGVAVYLEAHHLCTQMRGVREVSPKTRTTNWRGEYDGNAALRAEFLAACGLQR